jgi:hypothetical protein
MTNRIRVVTVILDQDYQDNDVQAILSAIRQIRGVDHCEPSVSTGNDQMSRSIATLELRRKVFQALDEALPIWTR